MGSTQNKSKIKPAKPGNLLSYTGIVEFDNLFDLCEIHLKEINECRIELDLRTTEFIEALGAQAQ